MRDYQVPLLRKDRLRRLRRKRVVYLVVGLAACLLLAVGLYFVPPIHNRLDLMFRELHTRIVYMFNPPEEAVFIPGQSADINLMLTQTLVALASPTTTLTPSLPEGPTLTPTITPTALPEYVSLPVEYYTHQCFRWNYCGPANLTMALKYWGWGGNRDDVAAVVKPGVQDPNLDFIQQGYWDKNVMPYELVDFVNEHTRFRALYRLGGEIGLLKKLIANGYPVIIEKGYYQYSYTGELAWMGHFSFITGFDEGLDSVIWQDTYPNHCDDTDPMELERKGRDNLTTYADLLSGWRGFNYVFIVVFPAEREIELLNLLDAWADSNWAAQNALAIANREIQTTTVNDLFFAWYNKGSSHAALRQYVEAVAAYDQAFSVYATLGGDNTERPYRILWYHDGPYEAYFHTGRYQDVINLADTTFVTIDEDTLEESLYWRAMAEFSLGDHESAIEDMREAVRLNPNFKLALDMLKEWGISP